MLKLLVTSKSNYKLLKDNPTILPLKQFSDVVIVKHPPKTQDFGEFNGEVYALGGGSVIDTAKIISGSRPCFAIPTNASGSAYTSHACVWNTQKIDIKVPLPTVLDIYKLLPIKLNKEDITRTSYDCSCHILESKFSRNATKDSLLYCDLGEKSLRDYYVTRDINFLITAGNWAGKAIEITGTNLIHAISYIFTLDYGFCHGDALMQATAVKTHKDSKKIIEKANKLYPNKFKNSLFI